MTLDRDAIETIRKIREELKDSEYQPSPEWFWQVIGDLLDALGAPLDSRASPAYSFSCTDDFIHTDRT